MKGHGFDLEATQLKQADRIGRLFLGFGIVFVWLITRGNWVVKRGYRHLVDHKAEVIKVIFAWDGTGSSAVALSIGPVRSVSNLIFPTDV